MSKAIKENFLTKENGCQVVEATSERKDTAAVNILNQNPKSMWVIQRKLPQYCIINTQFKNYPKVFNRVGFYCWHEYTSNPALIEISYSNSKDGEWIVVAKIRLALTSQKQYFKIKQIPVTEMKFLKVILLQNFGDQNTYMNQMQLGYVKEASTMDNSRQKTFSQFVKLTSTERELKRALEQIKTLSGQQEILRETVNKQNQIITKLQQSMKKMAKNLQKMSQIQEMQAQKIHQLQMSNVNPKKITTQSRQQSRQKYSDSSEFEIQDRPLIQQALIKNKNMSKTVNKNISYTKSNKNSTSSVNKLKEASLNNSKQSSKINKILRNKLEIRDSSPSLSEYNSSQDQKSKPPQKVTQIVRRLYSLLAQRQKREKQLNRKSQNGG